MLVELLQAVSGNPDREALLDALVSNSSSSAAKILECNTAHDVLLEDAFLTPFMLEAVRQESWRMLDAFREYGFSPESRLGLGSEGGGISLGAAVAMESPESIAGFKASRFGREWDPFERGKGRADVLFGLTMGSDATHDYWAEAFRADAEKNICRSRHDVRRNIHDVLVELFALARFSKDRSTRKRCKRRWEFWLRKEVDMSGVTPVRSALEKFSPMRHHAASRHDIGEKALVGLLEWARRNGGKPTEPVVAALARDEEWEDVVIAMRAGCVFDGVLLRHQLLAKPKSKSDEEGWLAAWDAWCAWGKTRPASATAALFKGLPAVCKDRQGIPLPAARQRVLRFWREVGAAGAFPGDGEGALRFLLGKLAHRQDAGWGQAWNAWCAWSKTRPEDERTLLWQEVPGPCKSESGCPLDAEAMRQAGGGSLEEGQSWDSAVKLALSLSTQASGHRARARL